MILKRKLLTGEALKKRAKELGVSDFHLWNLSTGVMNEPELQRRVMEAERQSREHGLWIVAVLSMVISVISAATALWAVLRPIPNIDCPQPPTVGKEINK